MSVGGGKRRREKTTRHFLRKSAGGREQFLVDTDILIAYLNRRSYRSYLENRLNPNLLFSHNQKRASIKTGAKGFGTAGHVKPSPSISSCSD